MAKNDDKTPDRVEHDDSEKKSGLRKRYTGAGIGAGTAVGVALGVVFDQIALGTGLGAALGAAIDVVSYLRNKNTNKPH